MNEWKKYKLENVIVSAVRRQIAATKAAPGN